MYHHLEFKYLNPFYVHSFHGHLSHMHAPSCSYLSLFSSSPTRSLHVSPILANMVSRRLPWEVSHSPYHYTLHGFHYLSCLYHSLVSLALQKKDTSVTFWVERNFFLSYLWHFYDNNYDKTRYHHRCGGVLLLWQKIMTENGLFVLGGPKTQPHDILWAVHDGKNRGRSKGGENFEVLPVTVGGWGPSDVRFSRTYVHVCEALALTEAEWGVGL